MRIQVDPSTNPDAHSVRVRNSICRRLAGQQRVRRIRGEQEIVYVGDAYEHETNGDTITERVYVSNNERVVAIAERINGTERWQFVHTDHLGSVDSITDTAGNEVERRSFDAWGAPRHPKWGNPAPAPNGSTTRRGFTWHEADDEVGLVNAKGRLCDPSGFSDKALSTLIHGSGNPEYVAPANAQLVQDNQQTIIFSWSREKPAWMNNTPRMRAKHFNAMHAVN